MTRIGCVLVVALAGCQEFALDKPEPQIEIPDDTDIVDEDPVVDEDPTAPDIEVRPANLDFGSVPLGCATEPLTVSVGNVGQGPLEVTSISLGGPDSDAYELTAPSGAVTLEAGERVLVEVAFTAEDPEDYGQARISVVSNDPDEDLIPVPLDGAGSENAMREQFWLQESGNPYVDVLFVVDNSESMAGEVTRLGQAMETFFRQFSTMAVDYHIGVTTTDMDRGGEQGQLLGPVISSTTSNGAAEFRRQLTTGTAGSIDEKGFLAAESALSSPMVNATYNRDFLRPHASLAVVVLSDEDDAEAIASAPFGGSNRRRASDFVTWLEGMKADPDDTSFSGMVGPPNGGLIACGIFSGGSASAAPHYNYAITQTQGVFANICNFDVSPFLQYLAFVVGGYQSQFPLDSTPAESGCDDITVTVSGEEVACHDAINGWTYDASSNTIEIHGDSIPQGGDDTIISYPVGGCD